MVVFQDTKMEWMGWRISHVQTTFLVSPFVLTFDDDTPRSEIDVYPLAKI